MKIGLFSMSGVRIKNTVLRELGVSLPGFVNRGDVIAALPSLGLLTIAGSLPEGRHEFKYVDIFDIRDYNELDTNLDVVCITSFTAQVYEAYELASRYKQEGIPVLLGGLHVTLNPEEAMNFADAICIGEGELLFPRMIEDLEKGQLQKVYRPGPKDKYDMACAPLPRYDLLDASKYNRITIQSSRGCPLDCEFCCASKMFGEKYRQKPVELVIRDLKEVEKIWPQPFIEFADDNTFVNKKWGKELLTALIPHKIRWFTETDISISESPELLEIMREAGCYQILIGFESIDAESMGTMMKSNWKTKWIDRYARAIEIIQSYGITVNGCFVFGFDFDDKEVFKRTKDFILETNLLESQVTVVTPFPGTGLYHRWKKEGRLLKNEYWDECTLFDVTFKPTKMSVNELEDGMRWLFGELYNQEVYTRRKRHYMEIIKKMKRQKTA